MKNRLKDHKSMDLILVDFKKKMLSSKRLSKSSLHDTTPSSMHQSRVSGKTIYEQSQLELIPELAGESQTPGRHRKSLSDNLMNNKAVMRAVQMNRTKRKKPFTCKKKRAFWEYHRLDRISFDEYLEFKRGKALRQMLEINRGHVRQFWDKLLVFNRKSVISESLRTLGKIFSKRRNQKFGEFRQEIENIKIKLETASKRKKKIQSQRITTNVKGLGESPVVNRIFHLLSKRFQKNNKYRDYFIDQIKLLTFKHKINDEMLLDMIKSFDLCQPSTARVPSKRTFSKSPKCTVRRFKRTRQSFRYSKAAASRTPEKQVSSRWIGRFPEKRRKLEELETVMKLFRGDQLFGPVVKAFHKQVIYYQRNFLLNLRFKAKLKPFVSLAAFVKDKKQILLKKALFSILFHNRSHLKLVFLIFVINRTKMKSLINCFFQIKNHFHRKPLGDAPNKPPTKATLEYRQSGSLSIEVDPSRSDQSGPNRFATFNAFSISSLKNSELFKRKNSKMHLLSLLSPKSQATGVKSSQISLENSIIGKYIRHFGKPQINIHAQRRSIRSSFTRNEREKSGSHCRSGQASREPKRPIWSSKQATAELHRTKKKRKSVKVFLNQPNSFTNPLSYFQTKRSRDFRINLTQIDQDEGSLSAELTQRRIRRKTTAKNNILSKALRVGPWLQGP